MAKEWLKIAYPQLSPTLVNEIDKKVLEARAGEVSEHWFAGNGEFFYVGDYKIRMGVDSFFEWMSIEIKLNN